MDIYSQKSRWKLYLLLVALAIMAISLVYTRYLANKLTEGERARAFQFVAAQQTLGSAPLDDDLTTELDIVKSNTDIPVIVVNDRGFIDLAANFSESKDTNMAFLEKELEKIKQGGPSPIEMDENFKIYYKPPQILTWLQFFPLVQLLLLGAFILAGYLAFSSSRRAEQNQVWVGMAKETAHQLGTPISAIVAWIEHLKTNKADDPETMEIAAELENDVSRLDLIADRFSKIGSDPELQPIDLYQEVKAISTYMKKRSPRKIEYSIPEAQQEGLIVDANEHLLSWVLENLIRNSLDAMGPEGEIKFEIEKKERIAEIHLSDTGEGVPTSKLKTIFEPGYSTKKRGWGLGLSLAKRIIEVSHKGKIFVSSSELGKGTTFTIQLPLS
jgi:two-component sensor histidine kinase